MHQQLLLLSCCLVEKAYYHRSYTVNVIISKRISVSGFLPPGGVLFNVLHKCQAI